MANLCCLFAFQKPPTPDSYFLLSFFFLFLFFGLPGTFLYTIKTYLLLFTLLCLSLSFFCFLLFRTNLFKMNRLTFCQHRLLRLLAFIHIQIHTRVKTTQPNRWTSNAHSPITQKTNTIIFKFNVIFASITRFKALETHSFYSFFSFPKQHDCACLFTLLRVFLSTKMSNFAWMSLTWRHICIQTNQLNRNQNLCYFDLSPDDL